MAYFGLSKPWIASLNVTTNKYSNALKIGEAVSTNVNPNYVKGELYGDNKQVENVNEFINANVTLGVTRLPATASPMLFGHSVEEDGTEKSNSEDNSPYVGYGFITAEMISGVKKYRACVLYKVQFTEGEEGFQTKGNQINFVTPQLNGTAVALDNGDWRIKSPAFDTEVAADEWIQEQFGVEITAHVYTEEELNALTVAQIEAIATERGYEIGSGTKAEKIAAFLTAQTAAGNE